MEFVNADDVDPISLTPISELTAWFVYVKNGKIFKYDAWAWLEYICSCPGRYFHPLTREDLLHCVNYDIYKACSVSEGIDDNRAKLLRQCVSTGLIKTKSFDNDGNLTSLTLIPESPIYKLVVVEFKRATPKPGAIRCFATVKYQLLDVTGTQVGKTSMLFV